MSPLRGTSAEAGSSLDDRLCDGAIALLIDEGIANLDLDRVDVRAGVPVGTTRSRYHHPGQLIATVLERIAGLFHAELAEFAHRYPDDPGSAMVEFILHTLGPARQRTRVVWTLLLDAGTRGQAAMYAEALWAGWERDVGDRTGPFREHQRTGVSMLMGFIGVSLLHGGPEPDREVMRRYITAVLAVGAPGAGCDNAGHSGI
jgi:AcrR family transcriptional regulator